MKKEYTAPSVTTLGTVEKLTEGFNKVGNVNDQYTQLIPSLIGSVVPAP